MFFYLFILDCVAVSIKTLPFLYQQKVSRLTKSTANLFTTVVNMSTMLIELLFEQIQYCSTEVETTMKVR